LDPLVLCHAVAENNNEHMAIVARQVALIAQRTGAAVDVAAHTRKGATAGDPESNRGGSATVYGVRIAQTLATMTEDEATRFRVPEGERKSLVRLDSAKGNYTAPDEETRWFRRVGRCLQNGNAVRPADFVGVLKPYDMAARTAEAVAERAREQEPEKQSLAQVLCAAMSADRCALSDMIQVARDHTGLQKRAAQTRIVEAVSSEPAYRLVELNGAQWRLSLVKRDPSHPKSPLDLCRVAHTNDRGAK
jgi:hypothetical protein